MVFVDIKIASIVTGGREAPKAEGLYYSNQLEHVVMGWPILSLSSWLSKDWSNRQRVSNLIEIFGQIEWLYLTISLVNGQYLVSTRSDLLYLWLINTSLPVTFWQTWQFSLWMPKHLSMFWPCRCSITCPSLGLLSMLIVINTHYRCCDIAVSWLSMLYRGYPYCITVVDVLLANEAKSRLEFWHVPTLTLL